MKKTFVLLFAFSLVLSGCRKEANQLVSKPIEPAVAVHNTPTPSPTPTPTPSPSPTVVDEQHFFTAGRVVAGLAVLGFIVWGAYVLGVMFHWAEGDLIRVQWEADRAEEERVRGLLLDWRREPAPPLRLMPPHAPNELPYENEEWWQEVGNPLVLRMMRLG
jgi:hypothetical protein